MFKKHFKILTHAHTGKVRPHEHTSYLPLALLLLIVGFCLTTFTATAWDRPGPSSSSVGITGTMPGSAPTEAATIKTPVSGQTFAQTPVIISGTCPVDTLVEIFKNDIFAGSTICTTDGAFTLEVDLLIGQNVLSAKVFDSLNQEGPASNTVTVTYSPSLASGSDIVSSLNFGGDQLIINTDAVFRGTFPKQDLSVPIDIIGGRAPYAVNIQWGDSTNKIVSRPDNITFQQTHAYAKAGTYQLSIQATDADGRVAFLTVAVIVNGQADTEAATTVTAQKTNLLLMLWPLYAAIFAMTLSFWVGEWREKRVLAKHGLLIS